MDTLDVEFDRNKSNQTASTHLTQMSGKDRPPSKQYLLELIEHMDPSKVPYEYRKKAKRGGPIVKKFNIVNDKFVEVKQPLLVESKRLSKSTHSSRKSFP